VQRPIVARIVPDADAVLQSARSVLVIDYVHGVDIAQAARAL
jgi:hypothetical protein